MSDPASPNASALAAAGAAGVVQPAGAAETAEPLAYAPQSEKLGAKTIRGSLFTVGSYFAVQVIRLAGSLVITRVVAPEYIGVMLMITTVMVGIRLFSDVGIGPALIANPRGESEPFLRTAFSIQAIRGVLIWLASCALAVPIAHHFAKNDPTMGMMSYLLPVAGFVAVIEGLRSTGIFRLQRHLRFGQLSFLDVIEIVVTVIGMVTWAVIAWSIGRPTIWALVIPPLVGSACAMIASHFLMRDRRDRFGWDTSSARDLMHIGRWIFISTVLTFLAGQFDRLIFGSMVAATVMGVYSVAVGLSMMPTIAVLKVGGSVLFPTFSRVADQPERFASVYRRARLMLLTVAAMVVSGVIACGPFVVPAMYNANYDAGGWMLQLLAIGIWFQIIDATNVAALLAHQRPTWMAAGNLTKVIVMFALVPIAYRVFDDNAFAAALVALGIADGARAIVSSIGVLKLGVSRSLFLVDLLLPPLIVAVGFLGLYVAEWLSPTLATRVSSDKIGRVISNGGLTVAAGLVVVALWGPACVWRWKRSRKVSA